MSQQTVSPRAATGARVHEIARELGIESKSVLAKLKEMGEFANSASSTITPVVAQRLRQAFAVQPTTQHPSKAAIRRARGPASTKTVDQVFSNPADASVARSLGMKAIAQPRQAATPLVGYALRLRKHPQVTTDEQANQLGRKWAQLFLTEDEMAVWLGAGVRPDQYQAVELFRTEGVTPDHLQQAVNGSRVGKRLKDGMSAAAIVGLLRQHGLLAAG